ncbi:MAG TPA: DMT family transporter [Bacteroidia bacterium]|nr:DMT family transporter [Bacteroidia bacterium]
MPIVNLTLSIFFSALLFVILRLFPNMKVVTFNGIVFNYFTAAALSFYFSGKQFDAIWTEKQFIPVALITGTMFIAVFYITGVTSQRSGVSVASIASKMSMVIPISAGIILYSESISLIKGIGMFLAFPAVYLVTKPSTLQEKKAFRVKDFYLPIVLFVGAGIVDSLIKLMQHFFMNPGNHGIIMMYVFGSAGLLGFGRMLYLVLWRGHRVTVYDLMGGILLGISNYLSLYFLILCLDNPAIESSQVFTIVNTGVVIFSAVAAVLFFNEKFTLSKIVGTLMALAAILIVSV